MEKIVILNGQELRQKANEIRSGKMIISTTKPCQLCVGHRQSVPIIHFDANDLAAVILGIGPFLEGIKLMRCEVVGNTIRVINALSYSRSLKSFHFFNAGILPLNPEIEHVSEFSRALAKLPHLEEISIRACHNDTLLPTAIATPLMAHQTNNVLRKIVLSDYLGETEEEEIIRIRGLGSLIEACQACTNLEELTIVSRGNRSCNALSEVLDTLGRLIKHTSSLKILRFNIIHGQCLLGLAEALKFNHSLKDLSLVEEGEVVADVSEVEAFHSTLKDHNFTLESLYIGHYRLGSGAYNELISAGLEGIRFYLALNQGGRDRLLGRGREVATTEDWWELIVNQDDLSAVYYFFRANTTLCFHGNCIKFSREIQQMQRLLAAWLSKSPGKSQALQRPQKRQRIDEVVEKKPSPQAQPSPKASSFLGNLQVPLIDTLDSLIQNPEAVSPEKRAEVAAKLRSALAAIEKCSTV